MDAFWTVEEVVGVASRHKEEIASWLQRGLLYLLGKPVKIAVTGMQDVGKTVLLDHLTGKAFQAGYQPPLRSERMESGTIQPGKARITLNIIPGQDSLPRRAGLDRLFLDQEPVEGVIHLVSWGYASPRTQEAVEVLRKGRGIDTLKSCVVKT